MVYLVILLLEQAKIGSTSTTLKTFVPLGIDLVCKYTKTSEPCGIQPAKTKCNPNVVSNSVLITVFLPFCAEI